ncbi:MAG: pyruvate kinase [Sideroxydans sp.]
MHRKSLKKSYIAEHLVPQLKQLRVSAESFERDFENEVEHIPPNYQASARNLLHYLALRQSDIRKLQHDLGLLGLSRLGRSEAHALSSIDAVLDAACALAGLQRVSREFDPAVDINTGEMYLNEHATRLLGTAVEKHGTRIMVTMPSEAAVDPKLVRDLLKAGMNIMRINCAHDDASAWMAMIGHLRSAEKKLGRKCKIYADLSGPKLRTGEIKAVGQLVEIKVKRDFFGHIIDPSNVWITPSDSQEPPATVVVAILPVGALLLADAREKDVLVIDDTRGSTRTLTLCKRFGNSWLAHCEQHAFINEGARCVLMRKGEELHQSKVSPLPRVFQPIVLQVGDELILTRDSQPGMSARHDKNDKLKHAASIPCTLNEVFNAAKPGQPIWFDDGKIGGLIRACTDDRIVVDITQAAPNGSKLGPGKGINLPLTDLDIPALTAADIENLTTLAPHIDMVGLSFVRTPQDVFTLHKLLDELSDSQLGVVLKIETAQAFENLPMILLASLRRPPVGVMVARGDLAVEIGFERLAEVQEEILWLCEAAHIPVIWATQVLESMAKNGLPSRAEVSDAALAIRAECVMLNKGPYILETVRFLCGVLDRMSGHQIKNRPMMRRLSVSHIPSREVETE